MKAADFRRRIKPLSLWLPESGRLLMRGPEYDKITENMKRSGKMHKEKRGEICHENDHGKRKSYPVS